MTNDDGRKPEGAPERSPKAEVGAGYGAVPALGEHTERARREFTAVAAAKAVRTE